jgi:hypothetical protein
MPRLKPLPVGPYAKRDDSKDVEDANLNVGRKAKEAEREADKQRKEKALNEWTHVLCLAIEDPDKSAEKVSRGLGWTLRDLLHTWNIHRDKPERIELGVALSCLAADVDSKKVKSEDLPRDGRAPEKLTAFLSQDPKAKSEKEQRTAAKAPAAIVARQPITWGLKSWKVRSRQKSMLATTQGPAARGILRRFMKFRFKSPPCLVNPACRSVTF